MSRPQSFRLPDDLLDRLRDQAQASGATVTSLVSDLLDEGLKIRRFPGIVYRDGPTGRRAGLVGGPDVWEIAAAVRQAPGRGEARLRAVSEMIGQPLSRVRLAVDFYAAFPDKIDERLALEDRAAAAVRELVVRRERLTSA